MTASSVARVSLLVLALAGFTAIATFAPGCGSSARQTAIKGAYVSLVAARDGFTGWDGNRQLVIVRESRSADEAHARLAAYRHEREPVIAAFDAAFALLAAAAYEDTVRAEDIVAAVQRVVEAISRIKRGAP